MLFTIRIDHHTGVSDKWINVKNWRFTRGRLQIMVRPPHSFSDRVIHEIDANSVHSVRVTKWGATPIDADT